MRAKKLAVWCEHCGGTQFSGCAEWVLFERLAFCSPVCRSEFQVSLRRRLVRVVPQPPKVPTRVQQAPRKRAPRVA